MAEHAAEIYHERMMRLAQLETHTAELYSFLTDEAEEYLDSHSGDVDDLFYHTIATLHALLDAEEPAAGRGLVRVWLDGELAG